MNLAPVRKACVFRVVGSHARFEPRYAGIVDHHVSYGNDAGQPQPVSFLAHIERFEPTSNFGSRCRSRRFVNVGDDDDGTFVMEAGRDGAADATRSAGNDARLIIQS